MNAEQKKRIAHEISNWKNACNCRAVQLTGDRMAALLHEMIAEQPASVPEPVAYQVRNGWASIAIYQRQLDAENYAKDQQKRHDLGGSLAHFYVVPLYTAPPAPSVPDKTSCLSTGGMTVWGDSVSIEKCNNFVHLASQAAGFKDELISTRAELADVARDAERLDWLLRNLPGGVLRYCVGVLSDTSDGKEFRDVIDAAIERQGGE